MSHGFIDTKYERLKPVFDRLLKIIGKDTFDETTTVDFYVAANAMLDLAEESTTKIDAVYTISRKHFIDCHGYGTRVLNIETIRIIGITPLNFFERIKIAYDVFKSIKTKKI